MAAEETAILRKEFQALCDLPTHKKVPKVGTSWTFKVSHAMKRYLQRIRLRSGLGAAFSGLICVCGVYVLYEHCGDIVTVTVLGAINGITEYLGLTTNSITTSIDGVEAIDSSDSETAGLFSHFLCSLSLTLYFSEVHADSLIPDVFVH